MSFPIHQGNLYHSEWPAGEDRIVQQCVGRNHTSQEILIKGYGNYLSPQSQVEQRLWDRVKELDPAT